MADEILKLDDRYSTAGQVTPEQLEQAAAAGFKAVLNLRDASEPGFVEAEAAQAEALGLAYRNTPVDPQTPAAEPLDQALSALEALPTPVLIHCRGGTRATAVALAAIAVQENLSLDQFIQRVQQHGLTLDQPQIKQFVQDHYGASAAGEVPASQVHEV